MISFISSSETINVALRDPNIFLQPASVHLNGIKTLLASGLSTFLIKRKRGFSNGPKSLSKNPPHCTILYN